MKFLLTLALCTALTIGMSQNAFMSEIHYENIGDDANEAVEVTIPAFCDCTSLQIIGYDGESGDQYDSWSVTTTIQSAEQYITIPTPMLQDDEQDGDGVGDGIALVCNGTLIEFLSYEGSFLGANGIAQDESSIDIIVVENEDSSASESLQRTDGDIWVGPRTSSFNSRNVGLSISTSCTPPSGCLNIDVEIRSVLLNDPGVDDMEFFEIIGAPNQALTNLWLIEIDGDASASVGDIDTAISLDGLSLGSNGLLLYRRNASMLPAPSPETTVVTDAVFSLENRNVTLLLVEQFTGAVGSDLDPNNDGILDFMPWCNIADGIGIAEDDDPDIAPNLGFELVNDNGGPSGQSEAMFVFSSCSNCGHTNPWRGAIVIDDPDGEFSVSIDDGSWFHDGPAGTDCIEDSLRGLTPGNTESPVELVSIFSDLQTEFCEGDAIINLESISDNGINGTWSPSSIIDPSVVGNTEYRFTADSGQCITEPLILIVEVLAIPNAGNLSLPSNQICLLDDTQFVSTDGTDNGLWSSSDMDIVTVNANGRLIPSAPGFATITYTIPETTTCSAGEEVATIDIEILDAPMSTFSTLDIQICVGDVITLPTTDDAGVTGIWLDQFDLPIDVLDTSTAFNPLVYTFIPDENQGCLSISQIPFNIEDCPCTEAAFVSIEPANDICRDENLTLIAVLGGSASSITWSTNGTGNFDDPTLLTTIYTPADADAGNEITFFATTDDPDGPRVACTEFSTTMFVNIIDFIVPSFDEIPPQCTGRTSPLPTSSLQGFTGMFTPEFNPEVSQEYIFVPDPGQCAAQGSTVFVSLFEKEIPTFEEIPEICQGSPNPLFNNSIEGFNGSWVPAYNPNQTQVYTFIPDEDECVVSGVTLTVTIGSTEPPEFSFPNTFCFNDPVFVLPTISDNGIEGTWDTANIETNINGMFTFTFSALDGDCVADFEFPISIEPCGCVFETINEINVCVGEELVMNGNVINTSQTGQFIEEDLTVITNDCDELNILIINVNGPGFPTSFSPNRDGINDEFNVNVEDICPISDYSLSIYNRWGEKVFESINPNEGWTGQFENSNQFGIFIWQAEYKMNDIKVNQQGTLTVIR